ncbi:MAG: hypothetical protein LBP27_06355, partial [Treponema sp.]|jgi:hypothetical protein|nr:hypothetical protein [Treponema sp.]
VDHRGTWKKGTITLVIDVSQLTISGATYVTLNGTYQITYARRVGEVYSYAFSRAGEELYGIDCKLQSGKLVIFPESGPEELHGSWDKDNG